MTDQNLSNFKAEDAEKNFVVRDDDGQVIDLTGSSINSVNLTVSTALHRYGEKQFTKTGTNLTDSGDATFQIDAVDTEDLRPGNYLYEVWVEYNNSSNYVAEVGKYFLKPRVDR